MVEFRFHCQRILTVAKSDTSQRLLIKKLYKNYGHTFDCNLRYLIFCRTIHENRRCPVPWRRPHWKYQLFQYNRHRHWWPIVIHLWKRQVSITQEVLIDGHWQSAKLYIWKWTMASSQRQKRTGMSSEVVKRVCGWQLFMASLQVSAPRPSWSPQAGPQAVGCSWDPLQEYQK